MSQDNQAEELAEFEVSEEEFDARLQAAEPAELVAPPRRRRSSAADGVVMSGNRFNEAKDADVDAPSGG